jgi:hypothetical protein
MFLRCERLAALKREVQLSSRVSDTFPVILDLSEHPGSTRRIFLPLLVIMG